MEFSKSSRALPINKRLGREQGIMTPPTYLENCPIGLKGTAP
jgi:hypothetical protein